MSRPGLRRLLTVVAVGGATTLVIAGCSQQGSTSSSNSSGKSLVVDQSFDLKTSDPGRAFELTGSIVDHALYQSVLTFKGSDVTKPVPELATYKESSDLKTLTLTMTGDHTFSDGSPVTADDVVFSLKRVQGLKGNPSFLLDGVTITKTGDKTITLVSAQPNPALPSILPNPSLGILNSKVVKAHGGTEDTSDKAEQYLNKHSAGSGPYQLESYSVTTKVVFAPNPHFTGAKPSYGRVVLQNVTGPTQKINVQAGSAQVALDLNADQVKGLDSGSTKVIKGVSPYLIYSWFNQNPKVSDGVTDKPEFLTAVRRGLDYDKILAVVGTGSTQPGGMVPANFLGALKSDPADSYDPGAAKKALAASGYAGQTITFSYANDITVNGLQLETLAETMQAQLKKIGITLKLAPSPISTFLDAQRAGTLQAGIMYWGPDYPDPADYLVFNPGQSLGLRAGWAAGSDPTVTKLADAANTASGTAARTEAYQAWQKAANASGPFIPVVQPGQYVVTATSITKLVLNPVWTVDFADIS